MNKIRFLKLSEIILIAQNQIKLYGGTFGIRDIRLLSTAAAMPEAGFDGNYLHKDIFEMAAAYIFHLIQNHPLIDGNKRTGLASGLVFLELNGIVIEDPEDILYDLIIQTIEGNNDKKTISSVLSSLSKRKNI